MKKTKTLDSNNKHQPRNLCNKVIKKKNQSNEDPDSYIVNHEKLDKRNTCPVMKDKGSHQAKQIDRVNSLCKTRS